MKSDKLEITILGLIARKSNHAYKIEKIIEKQNLRDRMDIGFSTIYSTLKKLQSEGYLKSEVDHQENLPSRKIYSITYAGKEHLRGLLKQNITRPSINYSNFDIALLFSDSLPKQDRKEALEQYKVELDRKIKEIMQELTDINPAMINKKVLLNRFLELLKAEKKWVKNLYFE